MLICSWDVGIIHLAYCIIDYHPDEHHRFEIVKWKQINLIPKSDLVCCGKNKKGNKKCTKLAKFVCNNQGYCGSHRKNCLNTYVPISGKKFVCCHEKKKKCSNSATFMFEDDDGKNYYCGKHIDKKSYPVLTPIRNKKTNKVPIKLLQARLLKKLDSMEILMDVDHVVIENQPSLKNPKMKAIASTLFDFFLMRSTIDKESSGCNIQKVTYISPNNKLRLDEKNTIKVLSRAESKTEKYKMTKALGIAYCKRLIKHNKKQLTFLLNNKKKDDLADCFLQGCYYLVYKCDDKDDLTDDDAVID
jgi:hypothetical protein